MSAVRRHLAHDATAALLAYDGRTGFLIWRPRPHGDLRWNARFAGERAGCVDTVKGYRRVRLNGLSHFEHRVVWLLVHGALPRGYIDHIDGDRTNNRIDNLREATPAQNVANSRAVWSESGLRGVHWKASRKRWIAQIMANGRVHHLGYFHDKAEAGKAYAEASARLNGEFAPRNCDQRAGEL